MSDSEDYIEKIFQIEYYLPLITDRDLLEWSLYKELDEDLDDRGKDQLREMINVDRNVFNRETVPYLSGYLRSIRDVKRYMNIFLLNYDYIKNNIYFPDYVGICMLRLKYPEVYYLLYLEKDLYLSPYRKNAGLAEDTGRLCLAFDSEDERDLKKSLLYLELQKDPTHYAINSKDTLTVVYLVESIFTTPSQGNLISFRRKLQNNHLAIVHVDCFDRYFDFSMEGRLDQGAFEEALQLDLAGLKQKIKQWSTVRTHASDLAIKLENVDVSKLDSVASFEKIIKAIAYFANLPLSDTSNDIHKFNTENLFYKFVEKNKEKGSVPRRYYGGNEQQYKEFVQGLFYEDDERSSERFMYYFAIQMINIYPDSFVLTHAELRTVIKDSFLAAVASPEVRFEKLWTLYSGVIRQFLDMAKSNNHWVPADEGIEMTEALAAYIRQFGFVEYLTTLINKNRPMGGYSLHFWIEPFFASSDEFEAVLQDQRSDPRVEEFIQFYYKCKDNMGASNSSLHN